MADLFSEINRLTRKQWNAANINEFVTEFLSIFKETMPITTNAPFTVKQPGAKNVGAPQQPALTIKSESGDAAIKVQNQDGSSGTIRATQKDGLTFTPDQKGTPAFPATAQASSGGGGIPGKVLSGSGSTYQVALYENGPASASTKTVTVTQLQIASTETIPAGTWAIVAKTKTVYSMQVATWV